MKCFATLCALAVTIASAGTAQQAPAELSALASKAGITAPVSAWCRATFRPGHPGAFAIAIPSGGVGGRYLVLEADGTRIELGSFERKPDLSCYTPVRARTLGASIRHSDIIHGQIAPRWKTTVVCAFTTSTSAECWQYSPTRRAIAKVGEWVT